MGAQESAEIASDLGLVVPTQCVAAVNTYEAPLAAEVQRSRAAKRQEKVEQARKRQLDDALQNGLGEPLKKAPKCADFNALYALFASRIKAKVYEHFDGDFQGLLVKFDHKLSYEEIWPDHIPGSKDAVPFGDAEKLLEPLLEDSYSKEATKLSQGGFAAASNPFLLHEAITYVLSGRAAHFVSDKVEYHRSYDAQWRKRPGNKKARDMRSDVDKMIVSLQNEVFQRAINYSNEQRMTSLESSQQQLESNMKVVDAWCVNLLQVLTPEQKDAFMRLQGMRLQGSSPNPQGDC